MKKSHLTLFFLKKEVSLYHEMMSQQLISASKVRILRSFTFAQILKL